MNTTKDSLFQKNWETYQTILKENYNFHTILFEKVPGYLKNRFQGCFSILDIGCGDVDHFCKVLSNDNLWSRVVSYTGVDLSTPAMDIGIKNVQAVASPDTKISFYADDMLNFVKKTPEKTYDFVLASLAIHHLQDTEKSYLVKEVHRILKPCGVFLIVDIFLEENEVRSDFVKHVSNHISQDWIKLNNEQIHNVIQHMSTFDFPSKLSQYQEWASDDSRYKQIKQLASVRFYKTIVLEI